MHTIVTMIRVALVLLLASGCLPRQRGEACELICDAQCTRYGECETADCAAFSTCTAKWTNERQTSCVSSCTQQCCTGSQCVVLLQKPEQSVQCAREIPVAECKFGVGFSRYQVASCVDATL